VELLFIALTVVWVVVCCDLFSGFLHWLEDSYGREDWPIMGDLVTKPNILHHHDPRYFTRNSWFYSARLIIVVCGLLLGLVHLLGLASWAWWLAFFIGINANEIHKWSHRSPSENGKWVTFLQEHGIIQSPAEHAKHHQGLKNTHYCVFTNYVNPVLERLRIWSGLEAAIRVLFGVERRPDHSIPSSLRAEDLLAG
jgi:hypothetical protein